ncbi:class II glutamine amidotransferase [Desulfoferrobacter suflitae]|uniref:class II glutamine amidotransferase n=1 Tax=Desulfoferrobacter suflitae TaxID=2865782 RepID=UPI0021647AF9|nr:class II glutamine amidotransferase [Desulfoferrobacter suflitae]MCK8602224.1 class II glutamine amidotransferase [Desulfoferrobacter suflitae]
MCDLFALSAATNYSAPRSLPLFAARAGRNVDGWGIGFFRKNRAHVEKSADRAYYEGRYDDSFQRLARIISSKFIIAHVRLRTSGPIDECHAHPFTLRFRGEDWIFAHNGKAPSIESYISKNVRLDCAVSDSAKTFEYLLDGIAELNSKSNSTLSLFLAVAQTVGRLVEDYPGRYNFLLTNGWVLFAFSNHRQFFLLKGSKKLENGLLLTTVGQGLSPENWVSISRQNFSKGLLLAIVGSDVVLQEDI